MAIDASIYSQLQPVKIDSPINAMAGVAQLQHAQNQNALAQYSLSKAKREDDQNTAISNAYKNALGPDGKIDRASLFTNLASQGAGAKIPEYQKTFADQDKASAETQKTQVQVLQEVNGLVGSAAGALKSNPTPQNAQFLISNLKNKLGPDLSTKAGLDNLQIPTDPQEIYQWADTHYLNAQAVDKKLAAETQIKTTQMNNDTSRTNNQETNATSRANNAATVGATIRGQNMTDARAKEVSHAPEYKQDAEGNWIALPKKVSAGQNITAMPVYGADGKLLAGADKPLTEQQGKATGFAARMQDANKVISKYDGKVNQGAVAVANGIAPDWLPGSGAVNAITRAGVGAVSPDASAYAQAKKNWKSANLRLESGAVISPSEDAQEDVKWFPQPGDPDSVVKQKAEARKVAERGMQVQAGPGAKKLAGMQNHDSTNDIHAQADAILKGK